MKQKYIKKVMVHPSIHYVRYKISHPKYEDIILYTRKFLSSEMNIS